MNTDTPGVGEVSTIALSARLGIDRSVVRRDLKKRGIATFKRRCKELRGAWTSFVSAEDAIAYLASREAETANPDAMLA